MMNSISKWFKLWSRQRPSRPITGRSPARLGMESLEERDVPAVFYVNSLADMLTPPKGVVTLRSAIEMANNTPGNNTIALTVAGTYNLTIPQNGDFNNTGGAFTITPNASDKPGNCLTIVNTSGHPVIVNGNHLDRVFDINPNDATAPTGFTVIMEGFTIENGVAQPGDGPGGSGGGIRDQGNVSLDLVGMTLRNNLATADGGGVSMENTTSTPWTLSITNSTITGNHAGDAGGGVEEDGSGKVIINGGTVISDNTCVNQGAGVWLDGIQVGTVFQTASLTVNDVMVYNNMSLTPGSDGGGIGNSGNGTVTITNSTLADNFTAGTGGGFGDQNAEGTLNIVNSKIINNFAVGGGGGIAAGGPSTSISGSTIDGNTSGGVGGGIFANGVRLSVESSTIANNTASGNGGGIELETTGTGLFQGTIINNTTITGNSALNNGGANGGGLDASSAFTGEALLTNDTITANYSSDGGGIFWAQATGSNLGLQNTTITGNIALADTNTNFGDNFTNLGGNNIGD